VALKTTDELIGVAGLRDADGFKYFGYYFRKAYWGKGYARELVQPSSTLLKLLSKSRIIKSSLLMKI
jgi:hypothetical protein